jgi:hypothetical protein
MQEEDEFTELVWRLSSLMKSPEYVTYILCNKLIRFISEQNWPLKYFKLIQVQVLVCLATGPYSLPNWVSLFLERDYPGKVIMW